MITEQQKQVLTPEQLLIAQKWDKENEEYTSLTEKLYSVDDPDQVELIVNQLVDLTPEICEHGKSIDAICEECDAIELILYPDLFDHNGIRLPDDAVEGLPILDQYDDEAAELIFEN